MIRLSPSHAFVTNTSVANVFKVTMMLPPLHAQLNRLQTAI
jgi:hypothetical protein